MGIWRIAIDEASGRATGAPEVIASGVDVEMDLPHLSQDGTALVFRSKLESVNPAAITFDPATGRVGAVTLLQQLTCTLAPFDVSPDGKWLALVNIPDRRQDLFIMHPDGTGLTRLTDDEARDWSPRFTPDGAGLTYFSNPSGKYEAWMVRLDGSGRTRLSNLGHDAGFAMFAPDGKRLAVSLNPTGGVAVGEAPWPMTEKSSTVTKIEVPGGIMVSTYWTRDGRWMSGYVIAPSGEASGFALYDVVAKRARQLNKDSRAYDLAWLPGHKRVVYFTTQGSLVMQDIESLQRRELVRALPYPPNILSNIVASPDGRTLYYGAQQAQANIWLVKPSANGAAR
jgi:Tol biopolymer transport system component